MPDIVTLDNAINTILDATVSQLQLAIGPGLLLDGVQAVVRGDRNNRPPETPVIWVFPETATNDDQRAAIAETWILPLIITPVVKAVNDPDTGSREATKLAARARSVLQQDRKLGLPYVIDVRSLRFEANAPWHTDPATSLYSAVAAVTVTFRVFEN